MSEIPLRVYFVGASGTGKTTLAKYVEEAYGLPRLPSASRQLIKNYGLDMSHFPTLMREARLYQRFQADVFALQAEMERDKDRFVSDRAFDHTAYTCLYGYNGASMSQGGPFDQYIATLRDREVVMFLCRPQYKILEAAWEQLGEENRNDFLHWNQMVRIDGMLQMLFEMYEIPYVPIDTADDRERKRIVDGVLGQAGHLRRQVEPVIGDSDYFLSFVEWQDKIGWPLPEEGVWGLTFPAGCPLLSVDSEEADRIIADYKKLVEVRKIKKETP